MKLLTALPILLVLSSWGPDIIAQEATLEECQRLQEKVDYYTNLRKRGGSAEEMERWRQERERYKDRFRDLRCRKRYGSKID